MTVWLVDGLIPHGAIVVIADADDGTPEAVHEASGADVVLHLGGDDASMATGAPVLLTTVWRDGLVNGHRPPDPFLIQWTPRGFERVSPEGRAA